MVLCVGEILADMIGEESGEGKIFRRFAGGAPLNVACGIKRLGGESGFVGSVGNDIVGRYLADFASQQSLDYVNISLDPKRNTTLAFVEVDGNGERDFCFYRKNTADYHIKLNNKDLKVLDRANIVHIGSLMCSNHSGRQCADRIFREAKSKSKIISFDVNYRHDLFENETEAIAVYKKYIASASIVKMSIDELYLFSGKSNLENALSSLNDDGTLYAITMSERGSVCLLNGKAHFYPSIRVKPKDTTGAGDAFFAGVLTGLDEIMKKGEKIENIAESQLERVFLRANVCGALSTLKSGAINSLPYLSQVEAALSAHNAQKTSEK